MGEGGACLILMTMESKDRHKINEVEMLVVVAILRKMVMMFFPQLPWFALSDRVGHTLCPYKSAR